MSMIVRENIQGSDTLDHLGLVAATIDKLGIVPMIDKLIPVDTTKGAKTSIGQRVSAMILNGLGFIDDRLYMFPKFLANKPVEKLFGDGIAAANFNDDALGRALDGIHAYGVTRLYSEIALPIGLKYNVISRESHVDTTTLTVYGEYEECEIEEEDKSLESIMLKLQQENAGVNIEVAQPKRGHAKNHRHDLKQMTLLLATSGKAGFPVWMEAHHGNASDKKTLQEASERMQKFCDALKLAPAFLHVGDSSMYSSCVEKGDHLLWLSRVPENITAAKKLITTTEIKWQQSNNDSSYKIYEIDQKYKNVSQRWLLVYSEHAYNKEILTLEKDINKEHDSLTKSAWHLGNQLYDSEKTALKQASLLRKKIKYHSMDFAIEPVAKYATNGRPKKDAVPEKIEYRVTTKITKDEDAIAKIKITKGRFILATNQLDKKELPTEEILPTYKEQKYTESGFKFIKDDTFELDSIFLKKPERINALMMIMTLCLMVYSFAQYFLREQLVANEDTLPLASGKMSNNPSMKWIYRMFLGIHVLKIKIDNKIQQIVLNLDDTLRKIIRYFGEVACKIYDIEYIKIE